MSNEIVQESGIQYGAFELKKLYVRNFSIGLTIAVFLHLVGIGGYYFYQSISNDDEDNIPTVRIIKYSELGPPPSISNDVPPQIAVSGPIVKPTVGLPVPVPDASVSPEQTIATQQELNQVQAPTLTEGTGTNTQISQDIKIDNNDDNPDINKFIPVEKEPEAVYVEKPKYPDIAVKGGFDGKVWVKVLVDKEGKPKKAVVIKSTMDIFNESAVDAALKFVFTPALQNNKPVTVWVVVPFTFTLKDANQ
jgi:periplasmic protein TonB